MRKLLFFITTITSIYVYTQTYTEYTISFKDAVHHEANVEVVFNNLENKVLELRMSRTSPGRYALHEFAKNIYNVKALDENGKELSITRPNPYQWNVAGHNGFVKVSYTLFANRGDGTYSQVDETHAHLNIPATFIYARNYESRPIKVKFNVREDLNWKVATQLKSLGNNTYYAQDLQYFMDSPTEISNHSVRDFKVKEREKEKTIKFVLHHNGTEEELDEYFEKVKKIVLEQQKVYGELPDFDYNEYSFLACYVPNASGDGMEHRNSTILTSTRSLADSGMDRNIGTVSHEFFHAWNVERIRPQSLEPFNYEEANMSGELWFAEGFTSYYTNLILCRAGILSEENYIGQIAGGLNYVWNSPGRTYFNPIEMSYQSPFVDAARSVDPVNRENTFISYYTYGSVLGLALDLSLRNLKENKSLDDFMKLVWQTYGKNEIPYTVKDLQFLLEMYTDKKFADTFFNSYIFNNAMPNYKNLLASVGVNFEQLKLTEISFGARLNKDFIITSNPFKGGAAYSAGLASGDKIVSMDNIVLNTKVSHNELFKLFKPKQKVRIVFERYNIRKETDLTFESDNSYTTSLIKTPSKDQLKKRELWLGSKQ